ncbi:MAG: SDR family NAD(P)-dependent oxidoreductase [Gemmatimonas sp.]
MPRKPPAPVVVITGAANGVGRALALEFAIAGSALVLGSRREGPLDTVRRDCEALHAMTIARITDLAIADDAFALANAALRRFKRVDVWINCALPAVNVFDEPRARNDAKAALAGYVNGANAALACFEKLGHGVLINVDASTGSMSSDAAHSRELKRMVCDTFDRIEQRAKAVPDVRVSSVQCPRETVAAELLAPSIVSLAMALSQPGLIGRVRGAMAREHFRMRVLIAPTRRRRANRATLIGTSAEFSSQSANGPGEWSRHDAADNSARDKPPQGARVRDSQTRDMPSHESPVHVVRTRATTAHKISDGSPVDEAMTMVMRDTRRERDDEHVSREPYRLSPAHSPAHAHSTTLPPAHAHSPTPASAHRSRGSWRTSTAVERRQNQVTAILLLAVPAALAALVLLLMRCA